MIYVEQFNGFIADNPNIDFERCDGTCFSYDAVNTASITQNHNMLTITGGQGAFPLAYIDTDSSLELTFESSEFSLDMFEMANAVNGKEGDFSTRESAKFEVSATNTIEIPYECQTGSVKIRGLEEATAAAEGKFSVAITTATATTAGKTVVTLDAGDAAEGDEIRVSYRRRVVDARRISVLETSTTAKGKLGAHWPIYSAGDSCADATIKGWLHLEIPRCRVTALPGFNNSYKSAA